MPTPPTNLISPLCVVVALRATTLITATIINHSRGRQLRMPGCSKFGEDGLPLASLEEPQRMRTSFYVPELPVDTHIIKAAMMAKLCPPLLVAGPKKKNKKRARGITSIGEATEEALGMPPLPKRDRREAADVCAAPAVMLRSRGDMTSKVAPNGREVYRVVSDGARVCACDHSGATHHEGNTAKSTVDAVTRQAWNFCRSRRCPDEVCIGQLGVVADQQMDDDDDDQHQPGSLDESVVDVPKLQKIQEHVSVLEDDGTLVHIIKTRYLTDDTRLDLSHVDGQALVDAAQGKVIFGGTPQNTGKTRWANTLIADRTKKGGKVLALGSQISLTRQTASQLTDVSQGGDANMKVLHYQDGIRDHTTNLTNHDTLVSTVHSLHHYTFPERIDVLLLDEARHQLDQILDWNRNDSTQHGGVHDGRVQDSAQETRAILRGLGLRSKLIVIICAQITRAEVRTLLEILGRPAVEVMELRMASDILPVTEVVEVQSLGRMVQTITTDLSNGEIVVVCSNVAAFGRRLRRHIAASKLTRPDGTKVNVVAWDSKWIAKEKQNGSNPSSNMGSWMVREKVHLLVHTTAVSPGMSIDGKHIVTKRYMVLLPHGADATTMAQMPDRVRKIAVRTIGIFSATKQHNLRTPSPQKDRGYAIQQLLKEYPEEAEMYLPEGPEAKSLYRMKPSSTNEYRMVKIIERYHNRDCPTAQQVVAQMDNTHITGTDDTEVGLPDGWSDALDTPVAAADTKFLAPDELLLIRKANRHGDTTRFDQTEVYTRISQMLPHFVVDKKEPYCLEHSLAPAAFRLVVASGYHKLVNFVALVQRSSSLQSSTLLSRAVYPDEDDHSLTNIENVTRCVQALVVLVGSERVDTFVVTGGTFDCVPPSTYAERQTAHEWMKGHWQVVTENTSTRFRNKNKLATIPDSTCRSGFHC
jgi:hypothetical protein